MVSGVYIYINIDVRVLLDDIYIWDNVAFYAIYHMKGRVCLLLSLSLPSPSSSQRLAPCLRPHATLHATLALRRTGVTG